MVLQARFTLNTTRDIFFAWLRQYYLLWHGEHPEPRDGTVCPEEAIRYSDSELSMEGYIYATDTFSVCFTIFAFVAVPLAPERCEVTAFCRFRPAEALFDELLQDIVARWPEAAPPAAPNAEAKPKRKLGPHGGTLDRVREARELWQGGVPKTTACKRAGIDPRTYDRYADDVIDWECDTD